MQLALIVLLQCCALMCTSAEGEPQNSAEKKASPDSEHPEHSASGDLCESSPDINEECKVCEALSLPPGSSCCSNPNALMWCHLAIQEFSLDADAANADDEVDDEDDDDDSGEEDDSNGSSEENEIRKRFGPSLYNVPWYGRHIASVEEAKRAMSKRYGNLFGSLFSDRKPGKNKRYGSLFSRLFSRQGDRDKRYGGLMGRLFSRYKEEKRDGSFRKRYGSLFRPSWIFSGKDKRYGSLFGPLFSSKDKRYGSLFGPLFSSKDKRYGSLMGRIYGRPKSSDDKRDIEMDKRYGSLMGRPFSNKKLG